MTAPPCCWAARTAACVRAWKRTRFGRPVSASCAARSSAMSAWRPARWTANIGSASSGSSIGAKSSERTASGARPRRMPSVADWLIRSRERLSRRRVSLTRETAVATRPVLTTKNTAPPSRIAGTSLGRRVSWWGRTLVRCSAAPAALSEMLYCATLKALRDGRLPSRRSERTLAVAWREHRGGEPGVQQDGEGEGRRRRDLAAIGTEADRQQLTDDDGGEQDPQAPGGAVDEGVRVADGEDADEREAHHRDDRDVGACLRVHSVQRRRRASGRPLARHAVSSTCDRRGPGPSADARCETASA